jgi:hypothetical protein
VRLEDVAARLPEFGPQQLMLEDCGCAGCDERIVRGCRAPVTKSLLRSTTNAWALDLLAKRVDRIRLSTFGPHVVDDHCRRQLLGVLSCTTVTVTIHMHVRYAMPMHCRAVAEREPPPPANPEPLSSATGPFQFHTPTHATH